MLQGPISIEPLRRKHRVKPYQFKSQNRVCYEFGWVAFTYGVVYRSLHTPHDLPEFLSKSEIFASLFPPTVLILADLIAYPFSR